MASVTGITAERAQEIWNASVVSGEVSSDGKLLLKTRGGTILDGGSIALPSVSKSWPVGSIFMSVSPTNPNTSLGIGTWIAWGTGRVPVGVSPGDAEFDSVEETGGAKSVVLTAAQSGLKAHTHTVSGTTGSSTISAKFNDADAASNPTGTATVDRGTPVGDGTRDVDGSDHTHTFSATSSSGTDQDASASHTNLQPYITCYMWKRTA